LNNQQHYYQVLAFATRSLTIEANKSISDHGRNYRLWRPVAALLIMSREQNVKNINMRMTSNINDVTYDQKTDQTTFAMSFFFILNGCCCGMENDTQCEPIIRSSDKSQKPAIG